MSDHDSSYHPLAALERLDPRKTMAAVKAGEPVVLGPDAKPVGQVQQRAALCCLMLLAFASGHPDVPDDFGSLPKTADALKTHVRPDGAVYLGSFQAPRDKGGVIVVYGDPNTTQAEAIKAVQKFRQRILWKIAEAKKEELGVFGKGHHSGRVQ